MAPDRPLGVAIIAVLQIIGSILLIAVGALAILGGMLIPIFGIILLALGAFMLIWGLIGIYIGIGLWGLKGWAWMVAMIFNIIAIILGAANFMMGDITGLVNVIIPVIIVVYLFFVRDHFK